MRFQQAHLLSAFAATALAQSTSSPPVTSVGTLSSPYTKDMRR